jgi:CTP:molybdopterin cytidylyltransferase MocA
MNTFSQGRKDSGAFVAAGDLPFPAQATIVRAGRAGGLAALVSAAPGGKDRGNQPIAVRQSGPPEELQ